MENGKPSLIVLRINILNFLNNIIAEEVAQALHFSKIKNYTNLTIIIDEKGVIIAVNFKVYF